MLGLHAGTSAGRLVSVKMFDLYTVKGLHPTWLRRESAYLGIIVWSRGFRSFCVRRATIISLVCQTIETGLFDLALSDLEASVRLRR